MDCQVTVEVSAHRVASVRIEKMTSHGTTWLHFIVDDEHGDNVLGMTLFQPDDGPDITVGDVEVLE
jgi:hypothetical protein